MKKIGLFVWFLGLVTVGFGQLQPRKVGRGMCEMHGGVLYSKNAYACYGDPGWRNYEFTFRAMGMDSGDVHICAGFRAHNRDDRYIVGLKGGSFDALYLERMGYMGTDDYLALRPLGFRVRAGRWYHFRVQVAGDRMRVFLENEKLPRIDVRDPNAALCPAGFLTLGGSYRETAFEGLAVSQIDENALRGPVKEYQPAVVDKERLRKAERAAYQPVRVASLAGGHTAGRTEVSLDGNWLFCPGYEVSRPDDAISPSRDDRSWHVLHVPDFWNPSRVWLHGEKYKSESKGASDRYYQSEIDRCAAYTFDYTRTNVGWYRQWVVLPASVQGKHLELSFDAVSKVAEVWVNGRKAGDHIGMFGDFRFDVSGLLHAGKNLVAVKVLRNYINNIRDADKITDVAVTVEVTQRMVKDLPHGFFVDDPAGIWQPVTLTITDPLHIADVFIKPKLTGADFEVRVRNDGAAERRFGLRLDIPGLYSGVLGNGVVLGAGEERVLQYSVDGLHPRLWSPENPNLYDFDFSLDNGDSLVIRSGFRTFESRNGFLYLNGRRYWLRGANQTAMPLAPNDSRLAGRFCRLMHDAHINATRTHTVPFTATWMDAADREGLGVSYEGTWPWLMIQSTMPDSALIVLWEREYLDLLRKYRNHPSLLLWTVNNEMKFYDNDPDFERAKRKMRIISDVVKKMRAIDPTRPIVFDSNYRRNKKKFGVDFFTTIDDGDIDDIHMYPNWYDNSIFDQFKGEFQARYKNPGRPLISQEMSTGYSNNETGHPVRFYTFVHQTPQALVGKYSYDYSDPAYFLRTHAFITRELAEALRRTDDEAAGIMHFASITWFRYVYSADSIQPYPVYYAMQKALSPLLVSAELWGRHFYSGERMPVRVCVVNDQDDTVMASPATLRWEWRTAGSPGSRAGGSWTGGSGAGGLGMDSLLGSGSAPVDTVGYYGRRWLEPEIGAPAVEGRRDVKLVLRLIRGGRVLSQNDYDLVVAPRSWAAGVVPAVALVDFGGRMAGVLDTLGVSYKKFGSVDEAIASGRVLVVSGDASLDELRRLRSFVSGGGRAVWLGAGTMASVVYPEYIKGVLEWKGEIMNMDIPESPVFDRLEPLDLRYFNDNRRASPAVCAGAFEVERGPGLTAPASFTRVHGYLQGEMMQRKAALEKLRGFPIVRIDDKGVMMLSQVMVEKATTDPVAGRLLTNMIRAAGLEMDNH
ncbi:MAG TPA: glycoside hydrolase family 2 TIM barrel-domain containing protein [Puia sp.]|nr:glycoside hydrolase family 2 TIM barrel-domain containing protein [Puia sp.]